MCSLNETELPNELRIIQAACSLTISVVGTFGNAMSLIMICKARLYRASPITMLIVDLCIANVISTGFIMPIIFATSFYNWWELSGIFCKLFGYIAYVAVCSECLIITNLALCHYLAVVHHVQIKKIIFNNHIYFRLFILLGLPWVIAGSFFLIPLTEIWDTFDYDYRFGFCTLINKQDVFGMHAITSIILTSTMTVIILYCYPAILYTYIKSRSITRHNTLAVAAGRTSHSKKLHFMISTIMINYLVTYLPFLILSIIDPCLTKTPLSPYTGVMYFCWFHVAINPYIYALLNTRINALWKNTFQCLQSTTVSQSSSSNPEVMPRRENMVCMKTREDLVIDNTAK